MKQTRFHRQFFTLPNILSYFRFLLIPLIIWLYCFEKMYGAAAWAMAVSAATDVIDGWIARHFNLVTDWGKIIDPLADKLTQIAIAFCLAWRYPPVWVLLGMLIVLEFCKGLIGLIFIKKTDTVEGSEWYGKAATVLFFFIALALIILPQLESWIVILMVAVESLLMSISLMLYIIRYIRLYNEHRADGTLPEQKAKHL